MASISSSISSSYVPLYPSFRLGCPEKKKILVQLYQNFYTQKQEAESALGDPEKYAKSTHSYRLYKQALRHNIKTYSDESDLPQSQEQVEVLKKLLTNVQEMRKVQKQALTNRGEGYTQLEEVVEASFALARSALEAATKSPSGYTSSTQPYQLYKRAAKELIQVMEQQCRKYGRYGVKMKAYSKYEQQLESLRALRHGIKPPLAQRTDYFAVKDRSGATDYFKPVVRHSQGSENGKVVSDGWMKFVRREIECLLFDDEGMLQGTQNELSDLQRSSFGIYHKVGEANYIVLEHRQLHPVPYPYPIERRHSWEYGYYGYSLGNFGEESLPRRVSMRWPVARDAEKKKSPSDLLPGVSDASLWRSELGSRFVPPEWSTSERGIQFFGNNSFWVRGKCVFDLRFKRKTTPAPTSSSTSSSSSGPSRSSSVR